MKIVARTDKGIVRENNQDSYTCGELSGGAAFAVVCDGMGGAAEGAFASSEAVKIIREKISSGYKNGMSDISVKALLVSALENANKHIYLLSLTDEKYYGMGTTAVAAIATDEFVYIAHVGDSRAYLITDGKANQLTRDHSVVQNMLENGEITPDEVEGHPKKHIITRAIGVDSELRVDFCQEQFDEETLILLCSDGLTNYVTDAEIVKLTSEGSYFEYAGRLVDLALKNGGGDNVTVVALAM